MILSSNLQSTTSLPTRNYRTSRANRKSKWPSKPILIFVSIFAVTWLTLFPLFISSPSHGNLSSPTAPKKSVVIGVDQHMLAQEAVLLSHIEDSIRQTKPLGRGSNGLPTESTPSLEGAKRAGIECDVNVDDLAYWNSPMGDSDLNFQTPFVLNGDSENGKEERYITFEPDSGGWNNIRMSLEIIMVIAAATGRTLVLPPDQPLYLLTKDTKQKQKGFADFFPLHNEAFQKIVPIITTQEFLTREGLKPGGSLQMPENEKEAILKRAAHCERRNKSSISCEPLFAHYSKVGYTPDLDGSNHCWIFDEEAFKNDAALTQDAQARIEKFCLNRGKFYYKQELAKEKLIHFQTSDKNHRMLNHFYTFVHFTNPSIDNHYKRFVRDHMHYHDHIFCAAGKIIKAIQEKAMAENPEILLDAEGGGGFSAIHIRRGDFQYKKVKIPAEQWLANTEEIWGPKEILYIATDERNKTFFDPIAKKFTLVFLDDYWELANLGELDPNYMGMIDTIVASRGREFAGTWFSTFTGYINRMRGYHGMSMVDSWYGTLDKKYQTQAYKYPDKDSNYIAREWELGWLGIDGEEFVDGRY